MFDVRILGTGQTRQDPLQFSVLGLSLEDIIPGFASHVAGFMEGSDICYKENSEVCIKEDGHVSSAFFYGDRQVSAVPLPAAFWLFSSGLILLGTIAARRRT